MNSAFRKPLTHIRPRRGLQLVDLNEIYRYRDLLYFLVERNIKVKYKQTVLGGLWAIVQPFFLMVVFTLFFGKLAKIPSDGIPYPIFNFSAMVAWTYFAQAITQSGNSIVGERNLIAKIYFPRIIIPVTHVLSGLLDFFVAFAVLILMMLYFHIYPAPTLTLVPFLLALMILNASGVGMFLAALNAKYRDIQYTIPFLVQIWMFASPIVYPASMIPQKYRIIYGLNPMCGVIEGFRSALLQTTPFPTVMVIESFLVSLLIFTVGLLYFNQVERHFADVL
jgi:lipopolysaccharide transport system permease protein